MSQKILLFTIVMILLSVLITVQYGKIVQRKTIDKCNNEKDNGKPSKNCRNIQYRRKVLSNFKQYQVIHSDSQQWLGKIIIPKEEAISEIVVETVKTTILGDDQRTWTPQNLDQQAE